MFELLKGIEIVDKSPSLFIKRENALVISDIHIGYEAALEKQGIVFPKSQYGKIKRDVTKLLDVTKPKKLVILGDLKHEFGEATRQEWKETLDFLDFLHAKGVETVVVRGNHDNFLIPILQKKGVKLFDPYYKLGNILFTHGHKQVDLKLLDNSVNTIIIGHEHPAIAFRDEFGVKRKFKCFLVGKFYGKNLVVMPAFSPLMEGAEVNLLSKDELLSPILKMANIDEFKAIVFDPEIVEFPLKHLRTF